MSHLYAILAGCNYDGDGRPEVSPLVGAESDAKSMAAELLDRPISGGALVGLTVLLGTEMTTSNLRHAIKRGLTETKSGDMLLLYFSGHGRKEGDGLDLMTFDSAYTAVQLIEDCGSDRQPAGIILDCCHAANVAIAKSEVRRQMNKFRLQNLQFLCGSAGDQEAFEADGHGVFTRALLAALDGQHEPPLLRVPLDLMSWCDAIPANLLTDTDVVQGSRDVLPEDHPLAVAEPPPSLLKAAQWAVIPDKNYNGNQHAVGVEQTAQPGATPPQAQEGAVTIPNARVVS